MNFIGQQEEPCQYLRFQWEAGFCQHYTVLTYISLAVSVTVNLLVSKFH